MKNAKKKQLETKGWKVGTVAEFLQLSPEESAYIEMKLALSKNLQERRKDKSLTQEQLARLLKFESVEGSEDGSRGSFRFA
jgi:hypothetical protein